MIDNGRIDETVKRTEHALRALPPTMEGLNDKLDAILAYVERADAFMVRIGTVLDGFEAFTDSPMGKMMMKKAGK